MDKKHYYYTLNQEKLSLWRTLLNFLLLPLKIFNWIISFFLAQHIAHLVVNYRFVPKQRTIHITKTSNQPEEDIAVVNFNKQPSIKWLDDMLIKLKSSIGLSSGLRNRLCYENEKDKAYVDSILDKIDNLINGTCTEKNCVNRKFDWSHIHLKGMEFLDVKMRAYVYEQLDNKYGAKAYKDAKKNNIEFFSLKTPDNAELDSVQISAPGENLKDMRDRKFVITCLARDQNYINWIKDLKYTATNLGATAISFNYRGTDYSRGQIWTLKNMVDDVRAQVERLTALGARPENICLDGMSLGGAIATIAAAELHSQGNKVKLNNERSFRSLPRLIFGFIAPEIQNANWWNPLTYLRFVLAGIAYLISAPVLWLAGWHVDAASAWEKIPDEDKIYSVVRDNEQHVYDGIIHDQLSSIASMEDGREGSECSPNFKPKYDVIKRPGYRGPHFISRTDLIAELGHREEYTNHDYFINQLKQKFEFEKTSHSMEVKVENRADDMISIPSNIVERPLIFSCSGGAGHISAAQGIINKLQKDNPSVVITQHRAELYQDKPYSLTAIFLRAALWINSVPVIGAIVGFILNWIGYPDLPDYDTFWDQMSKIQQMEQCKEGETVKPIHRPYIDVLKDCYDAGYEFTALNNASHLSLSTKSLKKLLTNKSSVEENNYHSVYHKTLDLLITAATNKTPFTRVVSTQALSLKALCDAVDYYNREFLPAFNRNKKTGYPSIYIDQYLTDLPEPGCTNFMENLDDLSSRQQQLLEIHAVNISECMEAAYFGQEQSFKAVHNIDPLKNPLVREGFKDDNLKNFAVTDQPVTLGYRLFEDEKSSSYSLKEITINPNAKVASIMIGSLAATATVDYVKCLLEKDYDHIFIFGGLNQHISRKVEEIIKTYSSVEQVNIRNKLVLLGHQTDQEMAPIMTRSNCVVIRGGGLSVMEQMSMPVLPDKAVFIHYENTPDSDFTSGVSWEDSNADSLIRFLSQKGANVYKTSPEQGLGALDNQANEVRIIPQLLNASSRVQRNERELQLNNKKNQFKSQANKSDGIDAKRESSLPQLSLFAPAQNRTRNISSNESEPCFKNL
ncbi:hypothetical protein [Legionella londiniensis]|uniref:SdbA protein, substrate of the Dot/Icm system n=1 Tax=Legionella londiniensis TaxID=45068 RepID=A0A0W0VRI6_9GAMM|nr:hypothetical protein [Legionella londiniensis]KTD22361.1 SdbA protein, substrate of the Dot/Icm system [Legionella londiniensis]STX93065.1 SdbA protein, substrate of the Dot/Icm system [Legionella londiniensis]